MPTEPNPPDANSDERLPLEGLPDTPEEPARRPQPSQSANPANSAQRGRGGRRSQAKAAGPAADPGAELERRVARVEFGEGALTRTRVPVRVEADRARAVLTDIDVLAIDVDLRLRVSTGILECKSGKGQSGEPDRLLWLTGFQRFLDADRATLVRQTTTRRGMALARQLQIRLLDARTLEGREASQAWMPDRFAHVGGSGCATETVRTDTQLKGLRGISSGLVAFLRHESLVSPSHRVLNALLTLQSAVDLQGVLPDPAGRNLASHALVGLIGAAIRDAGQLDFVPLDELRRRLELALAVGGPDNAHVIDVLSKADAVLQSVVEEIHEAYGRSGIGRLEVETPNLRDDVVDLPEHLLDSYLDLVGRMRGNPLVARDLLQTSELVCFDALVGDEAWRAPAFDHLFTPEHRQLLITALKTMTALAGPTVTSSIRQISDVPFDRSAPKVPDRSAPSNDPQP